jgi:mono/diheme cytochrome c family protein
MKIIVNITLAFVLALSVLVGADAQEPTDAKFVEIFLQTHCVRCHNADKNKGELNLDDLGVDLAAGRASFATALERLEAGDMPPEDEPRPDPAAVRRVTKWLQQGLAALPPAPVDKDKAAVRPDDGNHLPHALLFGGKPGPSVPPPPRLWRLSPEGYSAGFLRSLRVNSRNVSQPFALRSDPGIKDYSALYWLDEGSTDLLIRNAEKIVGAITSHKLTTNGGSVRVSMARSGGQPLAFEEFAPLLHPTVAPKREQLETAIRVLYRNALVREPSAEETESLIQLYHEASESPGDPVSAGKTMLMAPLLSPELLHRFEIGRGVEVRPGVRMLSPGELAFALSLAFSGEREPGLFAAATSGGLKTREDVEKHVRRILDDPEIYKPRILGFFQEYFGYDRAPDVCKDAQPDYVHNADQLVLDTNMLVLSILEKDQNVLKELLTTPKSFVNGVKLTRDGASVGLGGDTSLTKVLSESMASKIGYSATDKPATSKRPKDKSKDGVEAAYGLKEWPANQPVILPGDRIGILMQPSWQVAWSSNFFNDPVRRGLWIREHLLGQAVPQVPVGVVIVLPDDPTKTLRDRMQITKDQKCWSCHQKIDDLGFTFEAFDHFGRPRDSEIAVDNEAIAKNQANASRQYAKGEKRPEKIPENRELPFDSTGIIYASGDPKLDGPVKNAQEMIRRLAESDRARQVFIRYVFRYFMGRNETVGDGATLQEADKAYVESGGSFKALVVSLLTSEAFLYRTVPVQPNKQAANSPAKPAR